MGERDEYLACSPPLATSGGWFPIPADRMTDWLDAGYLVRRRTPGVPWRPVVLVGGVEVQADHEVGRQS